MTKELIEESSDGSSYFTEVTHLAESLQQIEAVKLPPKRLVPVLLKLRLESPAATSQSPTLTISMLFMPTVRGSEVIVSNFISKQNSQEEIFVIKDSKDLGNLNSLQTSESTWKSFKPSMKSSMYLDYFQEDKPESFEALPTLHPESVKEPEYLLK